MTARILAVVLLVAPCDNTYLWEPFELLESTISMEDELLFGEFVYSSGARVAPSATIPRSPHYALGKAEQVLMYKRKRLKDNQRITRKMVAEAGTVSTTPVQTSSTYQNRAETTSAHPTRKVKHLCSQVSKEDVKSQLFHFEEEFPDVHIFINKTDTYSNDIACIIRKIFPHAHNIALGPNPCMELLTVTSVPGMIHFMVTHDFREYCDAQVYGSIPSVIQILINGDVKDGRKHYITFNFIGNGGDMRFDAPGGTDAKTANNLLHVLKTLTSVVITGRPWSNKFPEFHRSSHMLANQQLAERKRQYRYKGISIQHQTFTIIPLLVYATLVAFVLTIPFSRREIKYDNVRIQDEPQDMSSTPKKKSKESAQTPPTPSAGQKVCPAQTPSAEPDGKTAHPFKNLKSAERDENKPSKEKDEEVLVREEKTQMTSSPRIQNAAANE
ncbi:hypothetical protein Q1695_013139 [Nippostrongylus brasiliensis]|nr:hypothetical protein Q1695_013139 [Nippostrongylus brasiliensis]